MFCRMKHAKTHVLSSKLLTVRCPGLLSVQLHKPPTCSFSTFLIVFAMRWDEPKQDTRIPKTDGAALCDIERASHKPNWALFGSYPWSLRMLSLTLTAILRHEGSTSCIRQLASLEYHCLLLPDSYYFWSNAWKLTAEIHSDLPLDGLKFTRLDVKR